MGLKLKKWEIKDIKTGRVTNVLRAKSKRNIMTRLGKKRAAEVEVTLVA